MVEGLDFPIPSDQAPPQVGGRLKHFRQNWQHITKDPWILQVVSGLRIQFRSPPPLSLPCRGIQQRLGREQMLVLDREVQDLLSKQAVRPCPHRTDGFYSTLFAVPKKGGGWRPVINLKSLNSYLVRTPHFKMETIQSLKDVLRQGDFMVKLDLKDAYLTVPVHQDDHRYLRFMWKGKAFEFTTLPFGLAPAPFFFTKLLRPVVSFLRLRGIRLIVYLDDILIMASSAEKATRDLQVVLRILAHLGFIINMKKCLTTPTQMIEFLGFILNSLRMVLSLPKEKVFKIRKECRRMLNQTEVSSHSLAHLIGLMTASIPAIQIAPLHYRGLQRLRTRGLRGSHLNYDRKVRMSEYAVMDLTWWATRLNAQIQRPILPPTASLNLETDASTLGWGAFCRESSQRTGGPWSRAEAVLHINWLELMAAFLAVRCFAKARSEIHIQLFMDSRVAIAYVNHLGGTRSRNLCTLALEFWEWCVHRKITLHAVHIPGRRNEIADWESRHMSDYSDWQLDREVFKRVQRALGPFSVDLFASFRNTQLEVYFSWKPDPSAEAVDALCQVWSNHRPYLFPPFALIGRSLHKVRMDRVTQAVLIAPLWPAQAWFTQAWFPILTSMLTHRPILLPSLPNLLLDPLGQTHPLIMQGHLTLVAWPISGVDSRVRAFLQTQPLSFVPPGGRAPQRLTRQHGEDGFIGVTDGRLILAQRNIANFLTGIFGEGKSHSTLNTYRSAISMSHDKVDGTSVGQHSALCRLHV